MADDINVKVRGQDRSQPSPGNPNGEMVVARASKYGEVYSQPLPGSQHALALEGSYFVAHNPTNDASTTLAGHAAPVLADADVTLVKPLVFLRMADASTKYAFLQFIEIEVVTAGATGAQACWAAQTDSGTTRVTTAGTDFTRVNPNARSSNTPDLAVQGGAVVVGAETAASRNIGFGTLRPSIEIAGDIKMFVFGGDPAMVGSQAGQAAAAIRTSIVCLPPIILGATDSFLLALHSQSGQNAAGVYKVRMGWWER
jgi:hypothetical protein